MEVCLSRPFLSLPYVSCALVGACFLAGFALSQQPTTATQSPPAAASKSLSPPPRPSNTGKRPLDDYVPCLFDDGEIYEMRALEQPMEAPVVKEGTQLDEASAAVVAESVNQILMRLAAAKAPVTGQEKIPKGQPAASAEQQEVQDFIGGHPIPPDKFMDKTLAEVPMVVEEFVKKAADAAALDVAGKKEISRLVTSLGFRTAIRNLASTSRFERPGDVVCSFSVMQWKETSDNFGRRVANQYVALQVTVRNLNTENEFLIHDIQIAVDTGLNRAQFGRFEAARDKLVVRNVAQRGQSEDRRNLIINSLQAIGAIAGGASAAVTQGLSNTTEATAMASAVSIFQGPFISGVTNIFPDHTLEHINHINDLGFSASSTNKTVAPIQGAVPLVTFLAERPLEQLPFAHCGGAARSGPFHFGKGPAKKEDDPGASQYAFCTTDAYDEYGNPFNAAYANTFDLQPDYYMKPYPFRKWKGAALDVLKHRIFVVVGGVHIKQLASQPTISSITCAPSNDMTIALSKISDPKNVTCTLKGSNLDLVSQVSLQNATDVNDKTQIQGTAIISGGDTTQATLTFSKDDVAKLKGTTYKLYYSLKGGGPQQTSLAITLQQPVSLSVGSLDFGSQNEKQESDEKSVVITNNSGDKLTFTIPPLTGPNASDYTIKKNMCVATPTKTVDNVTGVGKTASAEPKPQPAGSQESREPPKK